MSNFLDRLDVRVGTERVDTADLAVREELAWKILVALVRSAGRIGGSHASIEHADLTTGERAQIVITLKPE